MNTRILLPLVLMGLVLVQDNAVVQEQSIPLPRARSLVAPLGWTVSDAINRKGIPLKLFPYRGESESEDTVVLYYDDRMYLFMFRDRVWQVRVDENWQGQVDGVSMGMSRQRVENLWGGPIDSGSETPTWTLPDEGYPVRIRLYFDDSDSLVDLYVYRGDW